MAYLSLLKNPAWDVALLLFLVAAGFFWGISGGKKKMALTMLAIYVLVAVFPYIPMDKLTAGRAPTEVFMFRAGAFLILLILLSLFLIRAFKGMSSYYSGLWWEVLILSILAAGFLMVSLINLAPDAVIKNNLLNLSPLTLKLFADPIISKWWTILPIFGIIFL